MANFSFELLEKKYPNMTDKDKKTTIDYLRGLDSDIKWDKLSDTTDPIKQYDYLKNNMPNITINANNPNKPAFFDTKERFWQDLKNEYETLQNQSTRDSARDFGETLLDQTTGFRTQNFQEKDKKLQDLYNRALRLEIPLDELEKSPYGEIISKAIYNKKNLFTNTLAEGKKLAGELFDIENPDSAQFKQDQAAHNLYKQIAQDRIDGKEIKLNKDQKQIIKDELGLVSSAIRDDKEEIEHFMDIRNAKEASSEIASIVSRFSNVNELFLADLLRSPKELQDQKLKDYEFIAQKLGFDTLAFNQNGLYFIKDEKVYKVENNFADELKNVLKDNIGSISGGIYGAIRGSRAGFKGMVVGGALGAALGGGLDSILFDVMMDKEVDIAQALVHSAQEAGLNVIGDFVFKGVATTFKALKDSSGSLKNVAGRIADYTPVVGFIKRAKDGNKQAVQKLIDSTMTKEQQVVLKETMENFGGEIDIAQADLKKVNIASKFGDDSFITKGYNLFSDIFALKDQRQAQKDFIRAIRSDESGNLIAFITEAANASPKTQIHLKRMLYQTTQNLKKHLDNIGLSQDDMREVFNTLELGTKDSYKQAMEDILEKVYDDTYKVVLDRDKPISLAAKNITRDSIETITNKEEFLKNFAPSKYATKIPDEINVEDFLKGLESVTNKENFIAHLQSKTDANSRLAYLNLVEPTLKEWDLKLTHKAKGKETLIKSFIDKDKNIFYLLATKDNGKILLTGFKTDKINTIKNEIANADIIQAFIRQGSKQEPNSRLGLPNKEYYTTKSQSYNAFRKELEQSGVLPEDSMKFLSFIEKSIYNPEGVSFKQLNNALKNINSYYKNATDPNFKSHIKNAVEGFLKDDVKKGIDNIFAQNQAMKDDASILFETALRDYANMKDTIKMVDKLKIRDAATSYQRALDNTIKFLQGQGKLDESNFSALVKNLSNDDKARFELAFLDNLFRKSLKSFEENTKEVVFDSGVFFRHLEELGEDMFVSPYSKDYIKIAKDFHTLFKNDSKIAKALSPAVSDRIGSSIATTLEGAVKFQIIKGLFANIIRLMPHIPFLNSVNEKVQGAALRFHIKKALQEALDVQDFKISLNQIGHKKFTNATLEQIKKIKGEVSDVYDDSIQTIKNNPTRNSVEQELKPLIHKDLQNEQSGMVAQISPKTIKKMTSDTAIQKSMDNGFSPTQHLQAAQDIENLYRQARLLQTRADKNNDQAIRMHEFLADTPIPNAQALILVKESVDKDLKRIYTLELQELKKSGSPFTPAPNGREAERIAESKDTSGVSSAPSEIPADIITQNKQIKLFKQQDIRLDSFDDFMRYAKLTGIKDFENDKAARQAYKYIQTRLKDLEC